MIKSLKSKMAVGVVAVGLVASMGTAFAATGGAGAQVQSWYNTAKDLAFNTVTGQAGSYAQAKLPALQTEYNGIKNTAVNNVKTAGTDAATIANNNINGKKDTYIDQINASEATITTAMPGQFDGYVSGAKTVINNGAIQAETYAENEVTSKVTGQTNTSKGLLNTSVTDTKTAAVNALTAEINATKLALQNAIATEQGTALTEVKAALEAKIVELRTQLNAFTAGKVDAAKADIQAKGVELETDATNALDALVAGITTN
jgi:hypothetical protein